MSMHLCGPELTTTSTKKRQVKVTKAQQEEIERGWRERNVRLKQMGLPKETLEQYTDWLYGRGKKEKIKKKTFTPGIKSPVVGQSESNSLNPGKTTRIQIDEASTHASVPKSLNSWITGPVSSKPAPVYTGTKVIGIGTMHKSNMVPIFNDTEAEDISKMRR